MSERENPIRVHVCKICGETEACKGENCDFREEFQAHGYCMASGV